MNTDDPRLFERLRGCLCGLPRTLDDYGRSVAFHPDEIRFVREAFAADSAARAKYRERRREIFGIYHAELPLDYPLHGGMGCIA